MNGTDTSPYGKKWVIIHGHFYQPPRENPWLNHIETQESASPYHDWNERIYSECYRPNGCSRLLDPIGQINDIHNNYSMMSFNFGPTLMSWIEQKHPSTARRIVKGNKISRTRWNGHGNAVAQVYNHIIMPLASKKDQLTQIRWAKESFRKSFGYSPEGMWLAETAINMETVNCLISEKISFVILSPNQAESYRSLHHTTVWHETSGHPIDTRRPYRVYAKDRDGTKTGGHLDVFFFDEQLSKDISFNDLLQEAHRFGNRIDSCYSGSNDKDEVVVLATDGETFGHHKPFGDMCLAYFFKHVAPSLGITPVNFGQYLEMFPPAYEATLKNAFGEGTAWSCAHGVGRWIRDCGCSTGGKEGWNQKWRTPLRDTLNELQAEVDKWYTTTCETMKLDPDRLRDQAIKFFGSSFYSRLKQYCRRHTPAIAFTDESLHHLQRLLEAQKYMLFSFTSCGWFFSDINGIEPMQNLAYACRALQLGIPPSHQADAMDRLVDNLAKALSNQNNETGAELFEQKILPYFFHERMLAFGAAMQQTLHLQRKCSLRPFGYFCQVEKLPVPDSLYPAKYPAEINMFKVVINNILSGETGTWLVITEVPNHLEPQGWVFPWFQRFGTSKGISEELFNHPDMQLYTFSDMFHTLRQKLSAIYRQKLSHDSLKLYSFWFDKNIKNLSLLQAVAPPLPHYFSAPLSFIFQHQWDALFDTLETPGNEVNIINELSRLRVNCNLYSLVCDFDYSTDKCERYLMTELTQLQKDLCTEHCDRISHLLNIVDHFSLPVSKNHLEDQFYQILTGPVKNLYEETVLTRPDNVQEMDSDKREILIKFLNFAHRMNFNTDRFPLT